MKQAFRKQKPGKLPQPGAAKANAPARLKGPNWALLAVVLLFTGLVTFLLFEYVLLSKVPVDVLGSWVVVKSDPDPDSVGDFLEFHRDGSVHLRMVAPEEGIIEADGTALVEEDRLTILVPDPNSRSRAPVALSYLIVSVGDNKMELERDRIGQALGTTLQLERATEANMNNVRPGRKR